MYTTQFLDNSLSQDEVEEVEEEEEERVESPASAESEDEEVRNTAFSRCEP